MKLYFYHLSLLICIAFSFLKCASISQPTGGPKDTIPPNVLKMIPEDKSLNYNGDKIKIIFDEFIKDDNLKSKLIITPKTQVEYKTKVIKKTAEIEFEQKLDSNTTFTFNFRDGIKDITEGNIPENLVLSFSTGSYIDSLDIGGRTKDLIKQIPLKDVIVGIYDALDTLDIFSGEPLYFTNVNENGHYKIENIRNGRFRVYAWQDKNHNLKCEGIEPYGFLEDTLNLYSDTFGIDFKLYLLDTKELEIKSARPSGHYFEIQFSKAITNYKILSLERKNIISNLIEKNRLIRIYNIDSVFNDSTEITIYATDSLEQVLEDTLFVKFTETKRDKEKFSLGTTQTNGASFEKDFTSKIYFNKPIKDFSYDSIFFQYDSMIFQFLNKEEYFMWNTTNDTLTITKTLKPLFLGITDSILKIKCDKILNESIIENDSIHININNYNIPIKLPGDTLKIDSLEKIKRDSIRLIKKKYGLRPSIKNKGLRFYIPKSAFISIENDSSEIIDYHYKFYDEEENGKMKGKVITEYESFLIQLINERGNTIKETKNNKEYEFVNIPPGEYKIRVFIDNNANGTWEYGNIKRNQVPEDIIIYEETISIRANWELENVDLQF